MASRSMTFATFRPLQASRQQADRWSCDFLRQIQFGAEILWFSRQRFISFSSSFVLSKRPKAVVIPSRAQQQPGQKPPLALSPVDDKDVRALHVQAGTSARYARDPSRPRTSLYSPRHTPLGIWEDASARVARITASTPRIRPTRRRKYVAPVLLTSVANFPSPRASSSSPRSARFPGGR